LTRNEKAWDNVLLEMEKIYVVPDAIFDIFHTLPASYSFSADTNVLLYRKWHYGHHIE
jgi:hypothetical protein